MFVAIENNEMNVPQVLDWINRTKNANNNVISPEFAMKILGKTNFYGHIKVVLKNIKENCKTREDIEPYKEFILSCVDRREVSPQAMEDLVAMAKLCCCKDEFAELNSKPKWYYKNDCDNIDIKIIKSKKEFYDLEGENLRIFFDADNVDLSSCWLKRVKSLKFRKGVKVSLSYALDLPKDLDFSMCSEVGLTCCNLKGISLKFRDGAMVYLSKTTNLPKELDVSVCSYVDLSSCNLEGIELKFREGAEVYLSDAYNLPEDLDVSMCSKVDLISCYLKGMKLKFREGADVNLNSAEILLKELDVSMCSKVNLRNCDLKGVETIKFKDKEQEEEFMKNAGTFTGKVEYVGDDEKGKVMPMNNNGMEV